jgi:hypothetical protein
MLLLKFGKMSLDRHMIHRFRSSDANAFLTSDWDIPNCRAIREGVTPALKAARTAFNFPCAKGGGSAISTRRRFSVGGDCIFVKLGRTSNRRRKLCKSVSASCGILPRRFRSSRVVACRESSSVSLKCFMALGRFFGKSSAVANFRGTDSSRTVAVGNRSGVSWSAGRRPMASSCGDPRRSATPCSTI